MSLRSNRFLLVIPEENLLLLLRLLSEIYPGFSPDITTNPDLGL
jgi:hypothetical protein